MLLAALDGALGHTAVDVCLAASAGASLAGSFLWAPQRVLWMWQASSAMLCAALVVNRQLPRWSGDGLYSSIAIEGVPSAVVGASRQIFDEERASFAGRGCLR